MMRAHRFVPNRKLRRSLLRNEDGAYMMEMALIMPAFLMLIMGTFDMGFQMYAKASLNGAVEHAARTNTLEQNASDQTAVDQRVRDQMAITARYASLTFSRTNYVSFSDLNNPETFNDTNGNGAHDSFECFSDANNNGTYDTNRGAGGQGGASDVTLYQVNMTFNRVFPLWAMLGQPQSKTITAKTVLRNQPYTNQTDSTVTVCPLVP
ncbi:MAG: TadE/TadG family type IV pilus assembly protein [Sphingopyxis sp.]